MVVNTEMGQFYGHCDDEFFIAEQPDAFLSQAALVDF